MKTADFTYELPPELIADQPPEKRGQSRLLVMKRETGDLQHRAFSDLLNYLRAGDVLVLNDSKVLRARLRGRRAVSGGAVELLLLHRTDVTEGGGDCWSAMARPAKKLQPGERLVFGDGELGAKIVECGVEGERVVRFNTPDVLPLLEKFGEMPLPPYIVQRRKDVAESSAAGADDADRYQTVFAREPGSVAAPTAGLHFSKELLAQISQVGVEIAHVTLHVGAGTFKPVEVENPQQHPMHLEHYEVPEQTAEIVNRALREKRRVIAVGTTAVRTLESAFLPASRTINVGRGSTRLLILPGYTFQVVQALLTNFHLPQSTLLMLVSAFSSREAALNAYQAAIENRYRFYSYGDAMLIH